MCGTPLLTGGVREDSVTVLEKGKLAESQHGFLPNTIDEE